MESGLFNTSRATLKTAALAPAAAAGWLWLAALSGFVAGVVLVQLLLLQLLLQLLRRL